MKEDNIFEHTIWYGQTYSIQVVHVMIISVMKRSMKNIDFTSVPLSPEVNVFEADHRADSSSR